jgi:hypothetical protein
MGKFVLPASLLEVFLNRKVFGPDSDVGAIIEGVNELG